MEQRFVNGGLGGPHYSVLPVCPFVESSARDLFDPVQDEIENIVIVQRSALPALAVERIERP